MRNSHLSAPNYNSITYIFLKHLFPISHNNFFKFFNSVWMEQIFHHTWSKTIVISFLKAVKYSTNPNNQRSITLSSNLCKTFDIYSWKIINFYILHVLELNIYVATFQNGFWWGRSTIVNLIHLENLNIDRLFKMQPLVTRYFWHDESVWLNLTVWCALWSF